MSRQFCTFYLADLYLGIEAERVQEILRLENLTPVPLAPEAVCGLINLRGQIVSAIDLRRQLAVTGTDLPGQRMAIILSNATGAVGFVVDRFGDVVEVSESDFEDPPENLKGRARQMIRGAYKMQDRLLLILNTDNALHVDGRAGGHTTGRGTT
jgi:purine-binding chemotaxis protein CheW